MQLGMKWDQLSFCCTSNGGDDLLCLFSLRCELWNNIFGATIYMVLTFIKYKKIYLELLPNAKLESHGEIYLRL
jgi:hypothetical protein